MTDRPIMFSGPMVRALLAGKKSMTRRLLSSPLAKCQAGDRLWVRETFTYAGSSDPGILLYAATYPDEAIAAGCENVPPDLAAFKAAGERWRPTIHMPRKLSRLTLTVTECVVSSLQDISYRDVLAEGCPCDPSYAGAFQDDDGPICMVRVGEGRWKSPRAWFHELWDDLHGPGAWERNPEVAVISFTVTRGNIDR